MASKPKYAPRLVVRSTEPVVRGDNQKMPAITVSDPREAAEAADQLIGDRTHEHFVSMFLNARNKVIGYDLLTSGSVDSVSVNPSGIVRAAILAGARAIVTAHQHPSGRPRPSAEDEALWDRLRLVAETAGIVVLDNIVLGDGRFYAESERSEVIMKRNPGGYPPIPEEGAMQINPSRFDHHDYAGGPVHTRYVGDVKMTLWFGEDDEYQGTAETIDGYTWPWYLDIPTSTKRAGYDPHEYEFVNRVVASVFDLTEDDRIEQAVAWARNSDGTYDIRDEPPASWAEKNPGGLDQWAERRYRGDEEKIERWRESQQDEEDLPPALQRWLERKRRGRRPGRRSNPSALHGELERAARQTARTGKMPTDPRVVDWILEYPHTWDRMVKRFQ